MYLVPHFHKISLYYLALLFLVSGCRNQPEEGPDRGSTLRSFELAEGFQLELIASEPLVADPVAMEIDEYGRMYVVQMHGYPLDKSGSGSVRLLSDTDGDGVMDKSVTFAEGLTLPNGIMRWKKGVVVTDAPNVLYFEDTDGDGKADRRDTLLTGFALSNPQHKVNTPVYGLDNWIYLANEPATAAKIYADEFGDTGSEVRYVNLKGGPVLPQNADGRSVRFRPDLQKLEMLSTAAQYSNAQDVWGRRFFGNNTNHIYHEVIQAPYLTRNRDLAVPSSIQTVSGYGMPADVYPITENAEHQIFTSIGVFTSACGVALYGGGLFPEPFDRVAFIAEPVSNIVHAARLEDDGVSFRASRLYEKKEFLASKDSWFRPVNHYVGPDGALYVVDYHRRYIEHPEWMADDVVNSGALYDGKDKGRIYRITPAGTSKAGWTSGLKLGDLSSGELVRYLSHENAWYRKTAQRLLVDRQDKSVVGTLNEIAATDSSPLGRLHAAWTLEGLQALSPDIIRSMIRSQVAEIRENGIVLAEMLLEKHPEMIPALLELGKDTNARVRFQLLCTLGSVDSPDVFKTCRDLLFNNINDSWMQIAALSARHPDYVGLMDQAIRQFDPSGASYPRLIERLASMQTLRRDNAQTRLLIGRALNTRDAHRGAWQSAILSGLTRNNKGTDFSHEDFKEERTKLLGAAFGHPYPAVREASLNLLKLTGLPPGDDTRNAVARSRKLLEDPKAKTEDRLHAIHFLSIGNPHEHQPVFYTLLNPKEPLSIQKASLKVLGEMEGPAIAGYLSKHWQELSPQLRDTAIGIFLATEERIRILIESLEIGAIDPSSLDFYRQIYLMMLPDETLRKRTRSIFKDESKNEERRQAITKYKEALTLKGDAENGSLVFEKNCSACHQVGGRYGTAYGPDLGTIRNRRPESILNDVLDPSLSIADGFDLWEITLVGGETRQGVISTETPTTIALNIYGSEPEVINRQQIESMRALGVTIMPAGLESSITIQEMADLLAFLKKP